MQVELKRREKEEVKGVQSAEIAERILTETQKYINIVFSKDVELAGSFAGESSTLALTETENKKLERLDKEREKHNAGSLECVYTVRQYTEAGEPQKTVAKGQHAIGWTIYGSSMDQASKIYSLISELETRF